METVHSLEKTTTGGSGEDELVRVEVRASTTRALRGVVNNLQFYFNVITGTNKQCPPPLFRIIPTDTRRKEREK